MEHNNTFRTIMSSDCDIYYTAIIKSRKHISSQFTKKNIVCQTFPNLFLKWIRSVLYLTYMIFVPVHINGRGVPGICTASILKDPCFKCSSGSLSKSTNY